MASFGGWASCFSLIAAASLGRATTDDQDVEFHRFCVPLFVLQPLSLFSGTTGFWRRVSIGAAFDVRTRSGRVNRRAKNAAVHEHTDAYVTLSSSFGESPEDTAVAKENVK